jgi:mono/diheme cytochrome c family protein
MRCGFSFLLSIVALFAGTSAFSQAPYNIGRTPTADEVKAWDISVGPDGKELPAGSGVAKDGEKLYAQQCAMCHGAQGEGTKNGPHLIGGKGTLTSEKPVNTVGSFWPFATTIWDYINRAMPRNKPQSLTPDQVYSLTAFLLYRNGIIAENDVMDAKSLPKVEMPNRQSFIPPKIEDIVQKHCRAGTCP